MEIIFRDICTWEPIPLVLISQRDLSENESEVLKQFLATWPSIRMQKAKDPGSSIPDLHFDSLEMIPALLQQKLVKGRDAPVLRSYFVEQSHITRILFDWFPKELLEPLATELTQQFPSIYRMEVGADFESPQRDDFAFIEVPLKTAPFEDGTHVTVQPFAIAKYPVSIGQFSAFSAKTGYISLAEKCRDEFNYWHVPGRDAIPPEKQLTLPAEFLCYHDAMAYCEWAGRRLPTESEWLAASLLDDTVIDYFGSVEDSIRYRRRFMELKGYSGA